VRLWIWIWVFAAAFVIFAGAAGGTEVRVAFLEQTRTVLVGEVVRMDPVLRGQNEVVQTKYQNQVEWAQLLVLVCSCGKVQIMAWVFFVISFQERSYDLIDLCC
jgi:hypothetical protein